VTAASGPAVRETGTGHDAGLDPERAAFERDGVIRWGPFCTPAELAELRGAVERAFFADAATAAGVRDLSEREGKPLEYGLLQKVDLWREDPVFAGLVARPDVVERVERLLGGPVRLFRDHSFYKPGGKGEASNLLLHQDNRYWHLEPPQAATIWIALDDATVQNGCVHYVLGSQRRGRIQHERTVPGAVLVEAVNDEEPVPFPVPAGDALFHHAQVLHGSRPNQTDLPRRAYCIVYMRADITRRGEPVTDYPLAAELVRRR
jgi:2-oxoglutarate-dependent dioxygenase